ncbi:MAG: glycosyltransferase family 4 protein, partial [Desulfobacterales bacterium]
PNPTQQGVGFNETFSWDIPLIEGYKWQLLSNSVKKPCLDGFFSNRVSNIDRVFKKDTPNVVILTGWQSFSLLQALWACKRSRTPCLVRGDSNVLKPRSLPLQFFHRILLSCYDGFLAVGCYNRKFYLKNGIKKKLIFDCPHFIDNIRFFQQSVKLREMKEAIRASWSIPLKATCFVYAGKIVPKKRIFDLLRSLQKAIKVKTPLYLLVVGTGRLLAAASSFVAERKLPVTFAGFLNQTEIARAYVAADCLVLPSDYGETWGLVVNEAMACGLPAIVSDRVGCGPDLVNEGMTGSIFPFGDVDALANKILDAASDHGKLRKMGESARTRVFNDYSVERAVKGTIKALESIVGPLR